MNTILLRGGQAAGLLGFAVIVVAALARLAGNYTLGGLATSTLMLAGIGAVNVGVFCLLWLQLDRASR
jgi:hypothetical protein